MSQIELIDELTGICIRQADIIKTQAFVIEQLRAQAHEDEALAARLQALAGNLAREGRVSVPLVISTLQ